MSSTCRYASMPRTAVRARPTIIMNMRTRCGGAVELWAAHIEKLVMPAGVALLR